MKFIKSNWTGKHVWILDKNPLDVGRRKWLPRHFEFNRPVEYLVTSVSTPHTHLQPSAVPSWWRGETWDIQLCSAAAKQVWMLHPLLRMLSASSLKQCHPSQPIRSGNRSLWGELVNSAWGCCRSPGSPPLLWFSFELCYKTNGSSLPFGDGGEIDYMACDWSPSVFSSECTCLVWESSTKSCIKWTLKRRVTLLHGGNEADIMANGALFHEIKSALPSAFKCCLKQLC